MKTIKNVLLLCCLAMLAACTEDTFAPQSEVLSSTDNGSVDLISMVVPDIQMEDVTTRSSFKDEDGELKFSWSTNDAIGVVPMNGLPIKFPIYAENIQQNKALFDGGGWALKADGKYAAFYPILEKHQDADITNIAIDYTGQTQGNLMKYDFLATGVVQPQDGEVTFNMKRLSAILKVRIKIPIRAHAQYISITAPSAAFNVKGTLDLSGSEPVYTPTESANIIKTQTNSSDTDEYRDWYFETILMIPPVNLVDQMLSIQITSGYTQEYPYETFIQGKNFEAGKGYLLIGEASDYYIKNANLIAAAEANLGTGVEFEKENGMVGVRKNSSLLSQVTSINVSKLSEPDPTVCDDIKYFPNITQLNCSNNNIKTLDVSKNTKLTLLHCYKNQLTSLDVSKNTKLTELKCYENNITTLDVSKNTELTTLTCSQNELTSLDLSANTALTSLYCGNNKLTSLDLSNNTELTILSCGNNKLTSLDLSTNTALTAFSCTYSQLTSLDLTNNTALIDLMVNNNKLTTITGFSNLKNLERAYLGNNQFEAFIVLTNVNNKLISLDLSDNSKLTTLYCMDNTTPSHSSLTYLNVNNCTALEFLSCFGNQLTSLNINSCTKLTDLYCYNNKLTSLNLVYNKALESLQVQSNFLTSINILNNKALRNLKCYDNVLALLEIQRCTLLMTSNVQCGGQWTTTDKTDPRQLQLNLTMEQDDGLNSEHNTNIRKNYVTSDY